MCYRYLLLWLLSGAPSAFRPTARKLSHEPHKGIHEVSDNGLHGCGAPSMEEFRCRVCGDLKPEHHVSMPLFLHEFVDSAEGGCATCLLLLDGIGRCVPRIEQITGGFKGWNMVVGGPLTLRLTLDVGQDLESAKLDFFCLDGMSS